jgi:sigma-B regulation protein RsbU (phosphoserine phosphatase)
MVETRAVLRSVLRETSDPGDVLVRMNRTLCRDLPEGMFVTLFVARLEPQSHRLVYASAGQPAGLMRSDGKLDRLQSGGLPLGLFAGTAYQTAEPLTIDGGDILLIATDGLSEMRSPAQKLFGWDRQWETVAANRELTAASLGAALYDTVRQYAQGEPQHDDVTLIVAKCLG